MAKGVTTISGAFTLDSTGRANIETFLEANYRNLSGATVLVLPDVNSSELWIAIAEGGA